MIKNVISLIYVAVYKLLKMNENKSSLYHQFGTETESPMFNHLSLTLCPAPVSLMHIYVRVT